MVRETPGSNSGGTPIFGPFPFGRDSLETKKKQKKRGGAGEFGLIEFKISRYIKRKLGEDLSQQLFYFFFDCNFIFLCKKLIEQICGICKISKKKKKVFASFAIWKNDFNCLLLIQTRINLL